VPYYSALYLSVCRQGLSGQEIIQALVANSATFHGKTEFSQEKYLKKKQKKYAPQMTVRRPSGRSVCEAYFNKNPDKIW
jgi:tRNA (adenine-N(1)-)-methyltransferase non-catalytic subunit